MNLIKYIKGRRKGKDAHRIERDAMTDPFLSDALEGFDSVDGNHTERIERIQRQLALRNQDEHHIAAVRVSARKEAASPEILYAEQLSAKTCAEEDSLESPAEPKKKRRSLLGWAAAAILLLFIATGGYFWLSDERTASSPQLALADTKEPSPQATVNDEENSETKDHRTDTRAQSDIGTRSVSEMPSPNLPLLSSTPTITETEEAHILAEAATPVSAEKEGNNPNEKFTDFSRTDSIRDLNLLKPSDSGTSGLLAHMDQQDASINPLNIDEIGVLSNTNRRALSQPEASINHKEAPEEDIHALSQAQITSQGKIGGMLSSQNQSSSFKRSKDEYIKRAAPSDLSIRGRVVDEYGEPIPHALVMVKGTENVTYTDIDGLFALNATNADKLVATMIGYEEVEIPADTSKPMTIAMNVKSTHLDDIDASEHGRNIGKEDHSNKSSITPEPEEGYAAYRKYLSENLRRPTDNCADTNGRVVLKFYVNSSGQPYNIEVRRSLCPSADAEAVRLVREGGRWTTGNGEVRLTIKF